MRFFFATSAAGGAPSSTPIILSASPSTVFPKQALIQFTNIPTNIGKGLTFGITRVLSNPLRGNPDPGVTFGVQKAQNPNETITTTVFGGYTSGQTYVFTMRFENQYGYATDYSNASNPVVIL